MYTGGDIPTKWWSEPGYILATILFLLSLLISIWLADKRNFLALFHIHILMR